MRTEERLVMLGTGHATVTKCYNACFILSVPGCNLLVDTGGGNGILRQLEDADVAVSDIDAIFITHAHTDHILGAVWILRMIGELAENGSYNKRCYIFGNIQSLDLLYSILYKSLSMTMCRDIMSVVDFIETEGGKTYQIDNTLTVRTFDLHTACSQIGFLTTLPSGISLACCGDAPLSRVAPGDIRNTDWLIAEAFCLECDRKKFNPERISHGTVTDTARSALMLNVSNLVLYHTEDTNLQTRKTRYSEEAARVFQGNIFVPEDLETIHLTKIPNIYI